MEDPERRDDERAGQDAPESGPSDHTPEEGTAAQPGSGTSEPWAPGEDAPEGATQGPPNEDRGEPGEPEPLAPPPADPDTETAGEPAVTEEVPLEAPESGPMGEPDGSTPGEAEVPDGLVGDESPAELRSRLEIKDNHIRELYRQVSGLRLAVDEAVAAREAQVGHIRALGDERERLKERIRTLEEQVRDRRRRREGIERNVGRLERENERLRSEVARRDFLLRRREQEMEAIDVEAEDLVTRKDVALIDALRRVEGLERDLDERETEVAELRANVDDLLADLKAEYDLRAHLAAPANRLRAGIDLFNESEALPGVLGLSRTLGQPEVHVALEGGEEPAVTLTFTWQGVSWQTYSANPGLAVEEPRVYMMSAGEDLSGVDRRPPNARVGPGGRVLLGL